MGSFFSAPSLCKCTGFLLLPGCAPVWVFVQVKPSFSLIFISHQFLDHEGSAFFRSHLAVPTPLSTCSDLPSCLIATMASPCGYFTARWTQSPLYKASSRFLHTQINSHLPQPDTHPGPFFSCTVVGPHPHLVSAACPGACGHMWYPPENQRGGTSLTLLHLAVTHHPCLLLTVLPLPQGSLGLGRQVLGLSVDTQQQTAKS